MEKKSGQEIHRLMDIPALPKKGEKKEVDTVKQEKKCFIITPIGNSESETYRKAKGVIDSVIKPVLENNGYTDIKPSYEIMESGMITRQIVDRIVNDDLVIANLTGNNANVMYELAIRHAAAKPVIHICEKGTNLPFDIKDNRTAFYTNDMLGVKELIDDFQLFVKSIDLTSEYRDNPIYNGLEMANIMKKLNSGDDKPEIQLIKKMYDMLNNEEEKRVAIRNERRRRIRRVSFGANYSLEVDVINDLIQKVLKSLNDFGMEILSIDSDESKIYIEFMDAGNVPLPYLRESMNKIADDYSAQCEIVSRPLRGMDVI